jgi:FHS family L-fucose permease-like MFS transporter
MMQVSIPPGPSSAHSSVHDPSSRDRPVFPTGQILAFSLVTAAFFFWGMSNSLTDILVQQFKKSFELNLLEAQLVQTANFLAYGLMAIPAALLTRRFGYKAGILSGLCLFATGTLLFWPAAIIGRYSFFLVALFAVGGGLSILETSCNPFIAQFGDPATSERRLNFSQSFNPPGTIIGVLLGTWFIFSGVEKTPTQVAQMKSAGTYEAYLHMEIMRVVPTYVILGCVVLFLAFLLSRATFPTHLDSSATAGPGSMDQGSFRALFRYPHLLLAVVVQFASVGSQIGIWSNVIFYFKAYTPIAEKTTGYMLTGNLISFGLGRIISTPLMRYISPAKMTGCYAIANMGLLAFGITHPGLYGGYAILLTGFFMSIMFPTIFALGVKDLGPNTKLGGSLIVMSIIGGAIIPPLMGAIRDHTGSVAKGYYVPFVCYILVTLYGFFAQRITSHEVAMSPETV